MWTLIILWDVGFSIQQFEVTGVWQPDLLIKKKMDAISINRHVVGYAIYNPDGKLYETLILKGWRN